MIVQQLLYLILLGETISYNVAPEIQSDKSSFSLVLYIASSDTTWLIYRNLLVTKLSCLTQCCQARYLTQTEINSGIIPHCMSENRLRLCQAKQITVHYSQEFIS